MLDQTILTVLAVEQTTNLYLHIGKDLLQSGYAANSTSHRSN